MNADTDHPFTLWNSFSPGPVQRISGSNTQPLWQVIRLDLLQSWASGNKYYKLKYTLQSALQQGVHTIISKGGMFSNHLIALAEACTVFKLRLIAVIRSYTPDENNPTIQKLRSLGVDIVYTSPEIYGTFDQQAAENISSGALFIPEGGLNHQGIIGAAEIVREILPYTPTHIILAGGTLGTACGIVSATPPSAKVVIVPAWKGCTENYFSSLLSKFDIWPACGWEIWPEYAFGGFGRFNEELMRFMLTFSDSTGITLDPVYTAKLMYAIEDKIQAGYFKADASIMAIHTGGLQGLDGFRYRFPEEWERNQSSMTLG